MHRREFLKSTCLLPFCAAATRAATRPVLKTALNAYSFNKLLNDAIRKRGPGITLDGVLEFAAKNKFDAFDPTGYFFPGYPKVPAGSYVDNLKKHAADLGIALSGTGVRNNFTRRQRPSRRWRHSYQGVGRSRRKARGARDPGVRRHPNESADVAYRVQRSFESGRSRLDLRRSPGMRRSWQEIPRAHWRPEPRRFSADGRAASGARQSGGLGVVRSHR